MSVNEYIPKDKSPIKCPINTAAYGRMVGGKMYERPSIIASDLGYESFSEWYLGHSGSIYYRTSDKDKLQRFHRIEPYLIFLDQKGLERKGADLENRLEIMERENQ